MPKVDPTKLLVTVNPALAKQWHPTLNTSLSLETVYANSGKKAHWLCDKCDYEWPATVASRNSAGRGCPNCAGKVVNAKNSFALNYPEIAKEYAHDLNKVRLEELTSMTSRRVYWRCLKDSTHTWGTAVMNRVRQGDGCPYCSGRYPTAENNLAVVYPTIASEFDLEKNAPLTPYDFTPAAPQAAWWKCEKNHSWRVTINSRVRSGVFQNCPYCVGKKATHDNHLGITHPEVAKEYHPTLNEVPLEKIRPGSIIKRFWMCSKNSEHVWPASVASRTRKKATGCPECSPTSRTSSVEIAIREELRNSGTLTDIPTTYNAFIRLPSGKSVAVDILGNHNGQPVVVEYDSWWWHSGKGSKTTYQVRENRDLRKTQALLEAGYLVIRIREARKEESLPTLPLKHAMLYQVTWKQEEGIPKLVKTVKEYLLHP